MARSPPLYSQSIMVKGPFSLACYRHLARSAARIFTDTSTQTLTLITMILVESRPAPVKRVQSVPEYDPNSTNFYAALQGTV